MATKLFAPFFWVSFEWRYYVVDSYDTIVESFDTFPALRAKYPAIQHQDENT